MPRSGTSWLGQIFDSSPNVAFRMEPLFSYQFKNIINEKSSNEDFAKYFSEVYLSDDDFIHQKENRVKGSYSFFEKNPNPEFLVIKTTRHHNLLERYLTSIDYLEIVSVVRHPCAVISSWIDTDREFSEKGCNIRNDWKSGKCRKDGDGEFWGFDDWLSVTSQHIELNQKYKKFNIVKYTDLIRNPEAIISKLFERVSIPYVAQTINFLKDCRSQHNDDPYSIFKNQDVESKWEKKLDNVIAQEIIEEAKASGMGEFVE